MCSNFTERTKDPCLILYDRVKDFACAIYFECDTIDNMNTKKEHVHSVCCTARCTTSVRVPIVFLSLVLLPLFLLCQQAQ